jgi:hypothetical protein
MVLEMPTRTFEPKKGKPVDPIAHTLWDKDLAFGE